MIILLKSIVIALLFILAGTLFFHNFTSINADIGRHIKLGEIIWQTGEVPKTNLFSFTEPDFPFTNHHWLSEVVFYKVYSLGNDPVKSSSDDHGAGWMNGLKAIMIFKVIVLLATYFLLFLTVRKRNIFAVALAFLVSIFVFSARTEPRPEIFSYLIFSAYLLVIYRARSRSDLKNPQGRTFSWLWLLPILQLFWVNTHIYFIIGPIVFLFFLIERGLDSSGFKFWKWGLFRISSLEFKVFISVILANLINPNFITGAIYPLKVLGNYGYNVVENSSLFFLAKYFGHWAPQDKLFLISLFILAVSFVAQRFNLYIIEVKPQFINWLKTRIFDLLLIAITATLSFKMQRNIPLFALSLWPVMTDNLAGITNYELRITNFVKKWLCICIIVILTFSVYLVVSGRFYNWLDSPKMFGLSISSAAQDGTDFIRANNIQGPVFNNFDIGSYLVWQLYPDQKVFVDGRPEAYPGEFFEKIYKPMQRDEKVWEEMSQKYGINYIFFAHTDMTEWSQEFLTRIAKDPEWPMVFLNDAIVVFLKNNAANQTIIGKYRIADYNIEERIPSALARLSKKDGNAFINFGNVLYRFGWLGASAKVYEKLILGQPDNPYGYQGAGYAYASTNDMATQQKAADNLKKAIDLGFRTFNNYFTLGIIYANLGDLFAAKENIIKALEINPDSQNAKQALEVIQNKLKLK
ncbi:MAG: hypothetical protein A3J47_04195 [Candidatus Yanofskybacteria bacterium RIFCSPHIGHO2_02_FULL_43_22]|uniref:Uncharacterized protein n=1 Tax=Candidatus Yanofskybacteria bacterium RIFCSPHIGHO2_02_FULL_43_22 TaxID=1802681 RepID=A0A1F8FM34_9BACT|nr:MAG: hypothetical protein A3J47_04195 [Candidatus Yanofskybacteria bacterium RIFCSPHIGHO2_02_FULL_43_22]